MKTTLATIKAFIRKNEGRLLISCRSSFDGMVDCIMPCETKGFYPACKDEANPRNTLGIKGAWFVGSSRDYFTPFSNGSMKGFEVNNCCGSFILAVQE